MGEFFNGRLIPFQSTLAGWTAMNATQIPRMGEVVMETGGVSVKMKIGDGATHYLDLPYAFTGGSGGTGNFDAVLHAGNFAHDIPAVITDTTAAPHTGARTVLWWDGLTVSDDGGAADFFISLETDEGTFDYGYLRLKYQPQLGTDEFYVDGTTMSIGQPAGQKIVINALPGDLRGMNGVVTQYALLGGATGRLLLREGVGGFNVTLWPLPFSGGITANRSMYSPDESGTIVLHVTKDNITVQQALTNYAVIDNAGKFQVWDYVNNRPIAQLVSNATSGRLILNIGTGSHTISSIASSGIGRVQFLNDVTGIIETQFPETATIIDADYHALANFQSFILPIITAARTFTTDVAPAIGQAIRIINYNTSGFAWNLASVSGTFIDINGSVITTAPNGRSMTFYGNGTNWRRMY